jgi:hypothetical protein
LIEQIQRDDVTQKEDKCGVFGWKNLKNGERSDDAYADSRITLKRVLNGMFWTGFILLRLGTISGSSEHGIEPLVQ